MVLRRASVVKRIWEISEEPSRAVARPRGLRRVLVWGESGGGERGFGKDLRI